MPEPVNPAMTRNMISGWEAGTLADSSVHALLTTAGMSYTTLEALTGVGRCQVDLIHADKRGARCVLPASHQKHDLDHVDTHGHTAAVLVTQATIREIAALAETDRKAAQTENLARFTHQMAMMIRLLVSQETARQAESGDEELRVGLSEHHADGSFSFPVKQDSNGSNLCVTVIVKPGWK